MNPERQMSRFTPLWAGLVCASLGGGIMHYRHATSRTSLSHSLSVLDHSVRARLHVARAYLIADRTRSDDPNFSKNDVNAEIDRAQFAISDLLTGRSALLGVSREDPIDPAIVEIANAYAADLHDFRVLLSQSNPTNNDALSARTMFSRLEARADDLDVEVAANIRALDRAEGRSHALTLSVVVALILGAGVALFVVSQRRELARRELILNEQRLRLMLRQLPIVLWTTNSKLEYQSMTGSGGVVNLAVRDSLLGTTVRDDAPRLCPGRRAAHERALAGDDSIFTDVFEDRHFQARIRPLLDDAGNIVGTVGVALDITERVRLESNLRQAQRLESVGRLAAGVAHDFNNLMTIVMTNAEMLDEVLAHDSTMRSQLKQIVGAADRGVALTRQLLAFARRQPQQRLQLDVSAVVTDLMSLLRTLAGSRIRIRLDAPSGLPTVVADRSQLEQVVLNLASNARDAMPKGGEMFLSVAHSDVGPHNKPGTSWVRFDVRDTGTGIDPSIVSKVFDPFFTTKDEGRGTGLGLATVYGIADQSGGAVTVTTEMERGSTFSFWLPAAEKPPQARPDEPAQNGDVSFGTPTVPAKQLGVLIADDDPGVREMLRLALTHAGHRVLVAQDGEEAIAQFEADPTAIHILVTDVRMPGMRGTAVASRLRERAPELRVLFISGFSNDDDVEAMNRIEGSTLLHKPFSVRALLQVVQRLTTEAPTHP